jgi:EmrB/QacA subfamily drug resistance transporter
MSITDSEQSPPRRWVVLAVCCLSLLLVSLDTTIINVALPAVRADLHASVKGLQWIVDAYTLVLAMFLMMAGSLGDRFGRRRVFRTGLALFIAGSLLCSLAPGLGWLIAFRIMQAAGGCMLNPVAMAIVVNTFRNPAERARAIGIWAAVAGLSMALGPIAGGILVSAAGWRSIFWVNVPVGLAALALTRVYLPESRAPHPRAIDPAGQVLIVVLLGSLTYAIIEAPARGWLSAMPLGLLAVAVVAAAALLVVERRRAEPLIELRFFRSVPFSAATLTAVAAFAALGSFLFVNTLYLQGVLGFSPLGAGLRTLPMAVLAVGSAPLSGRMVAARGTRLPLLLSGLATGAGALVLVRLSAHTPTLQLFAAYALIGLGFGLVNAPVTHTATSGMPAAQAGVAAAVTSTGRQVGFSLGVAVSGSLVAGTVGPRFAEASHVVWLLVAGCAAVVCLLSLVASTGWATATGDRARGFVTTSGPEHDLAAA